MDTSELLDAMFGEGEAIQATSGFPNIVKLIYDGIEHNKGNQWKEEGVDYYRVKAYNPSSLAGRTCEYYYAHTIVNKSKLYNPVSAELQIIFDVGTALHEALQDYLKPNLLGSWECRKCRKAINLNTAYIDHVKKNAPKEFVKNLMERTHSHSTKPIPYTDKCPACGSDHSLKYAEWKSVNGDGLLAKVDGVLKYGKQLVGLEIKSCSPHVFKMLSKDKNPVLSATLQLCHSMAEFGAELGVVVFFDKSTNTFRQFMFELKDYKKQLDKERQSMKKANKMIAAKNINSKPKKRSECDKCSARDRVCFPK